MSDETPTTTKPEPYDYANDPDGLSEDDFDNGGDYLLDVLLTVALNEHSDEPDNDSSVGVTLSLGGTVVSGLAISQARWMKLWTESIRPHASAIAEGLEMALAPKLAERASMAERRRSEELPMPAPKFIHLKDATIVTGGSHDEVGLWRARRSAIDGWSLAMLHQA